MRIIGSGMRIYIDTLCVLRQVITCLCIHKVSMYKQLMTHTLMIHMLSGLNLKGRVTNRQREMIRSALFQAVQ